MILFANVASFTAGGLLLAISSFLPTYVQGVIGKRAMIAGLTLSVISLGWPIASTIAGKLMLSIGFRMTSIIGGISLVVGSAFYVLLPVINSALWAGIGSFFVGIGMGFSMTTFIVSIQSSVKWEKRGEATAGNMFMRILGGAVVVALLGGLLNSRLTNYLKSHEEQLSFQPNMDVINLLIEQNDRVSSFASHEIEIIQKGLIHSLSAVYWGVFVFAVISFIFILCIPKDKIRERN